VLLFDGMHVASDREDEVMSRKQAEELLMSELHYSRERAAFIVKQFDKNQDGKLSAKEMERFKNSVKQTSVSLIHFISV